jgi:hypothetical protein
MNVMPGVLLSALFTFPLGVVLCIGRLPQSSQILPRLCSYFCDSESQQTFMTYIVSCSWLWNLFFNVRRRSALIVYRLPSPASTTKTLFATKTHEWLAQEADKVFEIQVQLLCSKKTLNYVRRQRGSVSSRTIVIFCQRRRKNTISVLDTPLGT